MRHATHT